MPKPTSTDKVTRLLEMVVEEVSLVDRAANKRRFLIVKRSDEMDDTNSESTPTETDINTSSGSEGTHDGPAPSGDGTAGAQAEGNTLAVAVAALEGLTEAVELLGEQGSDGTSPRLVELAAELGLAADALAETVGAPAAVKPASGAQATPESTPSPTPKPADDKLATTIGAIRSTLQRVNAAVTPKSTAPAPTAKADQQASPSTPGSSDGAGGKGSGDSAGAKKITEQLAQVVTALQALASTVKEQQQRVSRLEKRFGLPASQPTDEGRSSSSGAAAGWPLDLNQPVDRDSVDKSVSFHDL